MTWFGNFISRRQLKGSAVLSGVFWLLVACAEPVAESLSHFPPTPPPTGEMPAETARTNPDSSTNLALTILPSIRRTNSVASVLGASVTLEDFKARLADARFLETSRKYGEAEPAFLALLAENVPDEIRRPALFEFGAVVQAENDLPRAQSIYAQYFSRWPDDESIPEVLLRQGQIFRQMGMNNYALTKFYGVMTAALSLKNNRFEYYQRIVLQAQIEIAETHYQTGQFADAAEFYSRLLQHDNPGLDRTQVQFRLVKSLVAVGHHEEAAGQAQDFLTRYPDAPDEPEVRYCLAQSLKALGRNSDALRQVLVFLQEQKARAKNHPEVLSYWQQRVGNEIANELYKEGDYVKALEVYLNLARLDSSAAWQLPVDYQIGITYEKLMQPQKAVETYHQILAREPELGTNVTPGLKAVLDMSRWRVGFIGWQNKAEQADRSFASSLATNAPPQIVIQ